MSDSPAIGNAEKRKVGRPRTTGRRSGVVAVKGTSEWKGWLEGLAGHCRVKKAEVIALALERLASQENYPGPPRRL